jgi:hypothetical protein
LSGGCKRQLVDPRDLRQSSALDEELIFRGEVTALLFTISDISQTPTRIEALLGGGDEDGEEEADES